MTGELLRAAFPEMFGDPVRNQKGLPKIALGDLIKVSSGNGLTAKNMDPAGNTLFMEEMASMDVTQNSCSRNLR